MPGLEMMVRSGKPTETSSPNHHLIPQPLIRPEILIMGVDVAPSGRVLNAISEYLMAGGQLVPEQRYPDFVDGRDVIFRPIHNRHFYDYLGCANWFYRPHPDGYPALHCLWPDVNGVFPREDGFDERFKGLQVDLSS